MPDPTARHRVVILGGGFAGLQAAFALKKADADVTIVDRQNHHLFQPLLYQVATASLSPADIAAPIRHIVKGVRNCRTVLARAKRVDADRRVVVLDEGEIPYDTLVLATGVRHAYFGHDEWEAHAPGLKSLDDALRIRDRFLLAFEQAELEEDPEKRRAALTFVIVGGGPTGVELAGAMAEIARRAMKKDFRRIDPSTARVILIEGEDRVLNAFDRKLSNRARADLESLGVDVWLNTRVTGVDEGGVEVGDERIASRNVVWAAGVEAQGVGGSLGVETDRSGRVPVEPDLTVPGRPEIFVLGDLAKITDPRTGEDVPGIAPAAMQMGKYAGRRIRERLEGRASDAPFRYTDKGMLATIGRARAVGSIAGIKMAGFVAWFLWAAVHIFFLIGFRNRLVVVISWVWAYVTFQRGARIIVPEHEDERIEEDTPASSGV
ncbi:unnamed protein product [Symbiodinium necroappetens]|uniref:NADH:ubiquinone reductase (non-electrogenic) n=1 Tax=Symbiodinium necroappetens TaxID=1628268 RepID=A0A813ACA2_9DINO|nr:unnamed protein product [Symbiodinium necroappetens]